MISPDVLHHAMTKVIATQGLPAFLRILRNAARDTESLYRDLDDKQMAAVDLKQFERLKAFIAFETADIPQNHRRIGVGESIRQADLIRMGDGWNSVPEDWVGTPLTDTNVVVARRREWEQR